MLGEKKITLNIHVSSFKFFTKYIYFLIIICGLKLTPSLT